MVIRIGLIKFIFTVQLWKFCSNKLIENESFVRTSRINVSEIKPEILHESLNNVLDNEASNATEQPIDLQIENRKLDTIGEDQYFYVRPGIVQKNDSPNNFYINYQKVYGIRYDPRKIKRSFNIKNADNDELSTNNPLMDITTTLNDLYEDVVTYDPVEEFLKPTISTPENWMNSINNTNNILNSSINYDDIQNNRPPDITSSLLSNIMKPSKIQTALQHLNMRIKNLFSPNVNTNPNTQRFLNVFNVIKFQNIPCASSKPPLTQMNGTCYHKFECDQLGGIAVDTCAGGFGVCCIFQFGCGGTTNQNISYFKSPDYPAATNTRLICTFTVELWSNVNQVLLEFLFFELKAPIGGSCVDDQFIVAGQSTNNLIPILCGINTGHHIYIDMESSLDRKLYLSVLAASPDSRAFNIRISQVQNVMEQAPQNCLQYYQGPNGIIQTFNYQDSAEIVEVRIPTYFNNLNYAICIKRLPEYCTIQYTNMVGHLELDFQLVNVDVDGTSVIPSGQAGAEIYNCADDFININGIRLCGEKLNDASITNDFTVNAPVTDYSAGPIIIPIRTNDAVVGRGFKIIYKQIPCME